MGQGSLREDQRAVSMIDFGRMVCCVVGHDLADPEIIDYRKDGLVVVASWCLRCGRDFLGCCSRQALEEQAKASEGPWGTIPCLFCKTPTLRGETTTPEMWPASAICPNCRVLWERL